LDMDDIQSELAALTKRVLGIEEKDIVGPLRFKSKRNECKGKTGRKRSRRSKMKNKMARTGEPMTVDDSGLSEASLSCDDAFPSDFLEFN
ncbi:hypothetical protein BaRGS_00040275, partial [Batillaria attramentaria]